MNQEAQEEHQARMCELAREQGFRDGQRGGSLDFPANSITIGGKTTKFYAPQDELRAYLDGYLQGIQKSNLPDETRKLLEEKANLELSGFKPTNEA